MFVKITEHKTRQRGQERRRSRFWEQEISAKVVIFKWLSQFNLIERRDHWKKSKVKEATLSILSPC